MSQRRCPEVKGPLAAYGPGFGVELTGRGYGSVAVCRRVWQMGQLSRWMQAEGVAPAELTALVVGEFLEARRQAGHASWSSPQNWALPLGYLRELDAIPAAPRVGQGPHGELIETYRRFLTTERGLAASTISHYVGVAGLFLTGASGGGAIDVGGLATVDVTGFVVRESGLRSVSASKYLVAGLRSLLRYLHVAGLTPTPLADAVPAVARRRGTTLPRGLEPAQVSGLLASCDRRRGVGRRDYAILLLLVRLGLRSNEVASLQLDDVDWNLGEVVIRGKGDRQERLPLPVDVGEAVAGYLRRGRANEADSVRSLFLRVRAPRGPLASRGVGAVVRDACVRSGMPVVGAHRLRHTAATEMLRLGASLPDIAQVLRHSRVDMTAIYAGVDRVALRDLAQPWPGGVA